MFDGIAYGKAGHVLDSVENFIGAETFRQGVHNYLVAHLYGNATAEDFWNAETSVSHKPVDRIMESYVAQPGVPVLTFGEPAGGRVPVSQERFYLSSSMRPSATQKWVLPVCFKTGSEEKCEVLTPETKSLPVPVDGVLFANATGMGYFRAIYAPGTYRSLVANAESALTPSERISLIGDEWAKLRADKATAGDYLDLVEAVKDDPSSAVIATAAAGIGTLYERVAASPEEKSELSAWVRKTFSERYAQLPAPSSSDSPNVRELRGQLFTLLGFFGQDPVILSQARELTDKYLADPASIDPTLRESALSLAARHGDAELFDKLLHIYETSSNPELQVDALRRLAVFEEPRLVERALDMAVSDKVRNQDAVFQLAIEMAIEQNRERTWEFIQKHWNKVEAQFTANMGAALVESTQAFCSTNKRDDVAQFFAAHKVAASDVSLRHAIEHINGCIELRSQQEPELKGWLAGQSAASGGQHSAAQ
jgi:aminopeptidase N/puromycin-sensitive aminopeptidase